MHAIIKADYDVTEIYKSGVGKAAARIGPPNNHDLPFPPTGWRHERAGVTDTKPRSFTSRHQGIPAGFTERKK